MLTLKKTFRCTISDKEERQKFTAELADRKAGQGDLTIKVHDETTPVHRNVLMSTSDYFKTMFTAGFSERNASTIDLSDVFEDITELNIIVDYMYTGNIELSGDNIVSVLNSACHFLQTDLQEACSTFLKVNISPSTCMGILVLAERYSLPEVQAICVEVIKAWFHVNLWHSPDTLDLPPHCLNVLIKENVIQMVSDELRKHFLRKWHEKFKIEHKKEVDFPKELDDMLKIELPQDIDSEQEEQNMLTKSQSDVLYSVFIVPKSDSSRCCVEVHAFMVQMKMWKFVLCHTFGEFVKAEAVPHVLGVTSTKAYFMFIKEDLKDSEECVISVSLKTGTEMLLTPPEGICSQRISHYGEWPYYFLWEETLHAMFRQLLDDKWFMFKEKADGQWEKVLQVPSEDYAAQFLTAPFGDALYLWRKEFDVDGSARGYLRYFFSKVTISSETGVYGISELKPPIVCDPEANVYPSDGASTLVNISTNAKDATLSFTHVVDQDEDLEEGTEDSWQDELNCATFTYDTQRDSWSEDEACQVPYPYTDAQRDSQSEYESEDEACEMPHPYTGPSTGSITAKPKAKMYDTKFPIVQPCKRLVVEDYGEEGPLNSQVERHYPETCVGALYYMMTISPYNTTMWRLDMDRKQWQIITYLPHSLDRFPHFQPAMAPSDWLMAMPDSRFIDLSGDIGESALARLECSEAGVNMAFSEMLLTQELYEQEWRKSWHSVLK